VISEELYPISEVGMVVDEQGQFQLLDVQSLCGTLIVHSFIQDQKTRAREFMIFQYAYTGMIRKDNLTSPSPKMHGVLILIRNHNPSLTSQSQRRFKNDSHLAVSASFYLLVIVTLG
jgi:hypothetical protein